MSMYVPYQSDFDAESPPLFQSTLSLKIRSGLSQNLKLQLNFAGHDGLLCFDLLYRQSLGESQFHPAGFEMQPTDL
jgi:hypothetical protein